MNLQPGKARDSRCRLLSISLHVANLHVGWHWRGDPRSRWDTMMSSRSRLGQELVQRNRRYRSFPTHRTLRGKKNGKVATLELF